MAEEVTKEVHHHHDGDSAERGNPSGTILIFVVFIVLIFVVLYFFTSIGSMFQGVGTNGGVQVPEQVDVNVNTSQGGE